MHVKTKKKLTLSVETLRRLTAREIQDAVGAATTRFVLNCTTLCTVDTCTDDSCFC